MRTKLPTSVLCSPPPLPYILAILILFWQNREWALFVDGNLKKVSLGLKSNNSFSDPEPVQRGGRLDGRGHERLVEVRMRNRVQGGASSQGHPVGTLEPVGALQKKQGDQFEQGPSCFPPLFVAFSVYDFLPSLCLFLLLSVSPSLCLSVSLSL